MSGKLYMVGGASGGSGLGTPTGSLGEIEIQNPAGGAAMLAFHRNGSWAEYFGLDTDNIWKFGGWSNGAATSRIWHDRIASSSLGQPGYIKFPNGLIVQWGIIPGVADTNGNVIATFPIVFPGGLLAVSHWNDHHSVDLVTSTWQDTNYPNVGGVAIHHVGNDGSSWAGRGTRTGWIAIGI
jgi:hypothetical protein